MQRIYKLTIFLAGLAALSAVLFAASASAFPSYFYSTSFGSTGTENGQFKEPMAAATDSAGNFWVVDHKTKNVQKFNSKGEFLLKITKGKSNFIEPTDVAIDGAGNAWVVDSGANRIIKFSSTGSYISEFGEAGSAPGKLGSPRNIAIDSSGNLWITEVENYRVQEFNSTGTYIRSFGSKGMSFVNEEEGNGKFSFITGIAIDAENNVWVLDMNGLKKEIPGYPPEYTSITRAEEFNSSGVFIKQIGSKVLGGNSGLDALSISAGYLWIADIECHCVKVLNTSGGLVGRFGGKEAGEGSVVWPNGVTFDASGNPWMVVWGGTTAESRLEKWVPPLPGVVSGTATGLTFSEATLNGEVSARGINTTYQFEYGTTTSYGSKAPASPASAGESSSYVTVKQALSGLTPSTTYHYRLVATNPAGTTSGTDRTFTTSSISSQLEALTLINQFEGGSESKANFNTMWGTLGWATGATQPKGIDSFGGWLPVDSFPAVSGTYYNEKISSKGYGTATSVFLDEVTIGSERYFSLWLDMSTPTGAKTGYELRCTNTGEYKAGGAPFTIALVKWQAGVQTVLASEANVGLGPTRRLALVDEGSKVSAWLKKSGEFTSLLSASDSSFSSGMSGMEANGTTTYLMEFKTGGF